MFRYVILDAGPLIQDSFMPSLAETFYTVPEVIAEIRDVATRDRLSKASFPFKVQNPSAKSLQIVKAFARATGDAASLSSTDLKVAALALTLELEVNGENSRVRLDPSQLARETHLGAGKTDHKASHVDKNGLDDGGWITPDNIAQKKAQTMGALDDDDDGDEQVDTANNNNNSKVACMSTDFALQNLLLQMRLILVAPEGFRIKQIKNWLLRCHACYWNTHQMERRFCDRCGNPTLIRTSYKVDAQGVTHLFLKKNFQYNNRGTIASIPLPGTNTKSSSSSGAKTKATLLLREDQKEYQQAMRNYRRLERKAERDEASFCLDDIDERLVNVFGELNMNQKDGLSSRKKATLGTSSLIPLPTIGFGRRNPNVARRKV